MGAAGRASPAGPTYSDETGGAVLATFVIGLREGLEAALIVSIVAAFLRRNGRSLVPMWTGVAAALTLSVGIGVTLALVEASLPQAAQEGMEAVISALAVVFVTSMVLWMSTHARGMKRELEASAADALGDGTSRALAIMAFLAVLKEGIETSVFLLATFQAASSTVTAALGAVLGILTSVGLGWGMYRGSLRINLARFFKITSVFLVLVAGGLVVTTLRSAHEAGWLLAGQQRTADLSWLAAPGSVQGSLLTGVLGIPPDPRLVEVLAWLAYVVPMLLILFWPASHRPNEQTAQRIRYGVAAVLGVAAVTLAVTVHEPALAKLGPAPLVDGQGNDVGSATVWTADDGQPSLMLDMRSRRVAELPLSGIDDHLVHGGFEAVHSSMAVDLPAIDLPTTLTAAQLAALNGGRLPIGVNLQRSPGPFNASWARSGTRDTWMTTDPEPQLLDVSQKAVTTVTLTGGGLTSPRTVSIDDQVTLPDGSAFGSGTWSAAPAYTASVADEISAQRIGAAEAQFWGRVVPALLFAVALLLVFVALRHTRRRQDALPAVGGVPSGSAAAPRATTPTPSYPATPHADAHKQGARHS